MMGGNQTLLEECFDIFIRTMDEALCEIETAVHANDASGLNKWAHKFRGSLEHLAADRAARVAARLEDATIHTGYAALHRITAGIQFRQGCGRQR